MNTQIETIALNLLAFGSTQAESAHFQSLGLKKWLQEQLSPDSASDADCNQRIQQAKLRIHYDAGKDYPALDETRPLNTLNLPIQEIWPLTDNKIPRAGQEKSRPRLELASATVIRAVYSHWQLKEVICDFWHNHFNVNAADGTVAAALPTYDREIIRPHCFGNFREMLEAVATSTAMLYYLNNRSSKAGIANENYARELFELHTLGRDHYLNEFYNRWRDVPGGPQGKPVGYIDQDVYEAARAFTGWAVEDGSGLGGSDHLPVTGKFTYVESWHDNYQKRVLGIEFDPFQPSMSDGRKVLDLVANHPATAEYLCTKLCRRLVSDHPSRSLISDATEVWRKNANKPDQIKKVIEFIALSDEFSATWGDKVKRPLELVASYVRTTGMEFEPTEGLLGEIENAGQRLYAWSTPTGHPDNKEYWLSTNAMRRRWTIISGLTDNWWKTGIFDPLLNLDESTMTVAQATDYWLHRILGGKANPKMMATILNGLNIPIDKRFEIGKHADSSKLLRHIVSFIAMSPDFQLR